MPSNIRKPKRFVKELPEKAWEYIKECLENTKDMATNKGVVEVRDRHIPTIQYFLRVWLPMNCTDTISRDTWYRWLNERDEEGEPTDLSDTIKSIDELFKSVAEDIVANEGKGIFYAKNRLGMTDKQELKHDGNVQILNIDPVDGDGK